MEGILGIQESVAFDESISQYEVHAHQPYTAANYNNSDEIHISIHQDLCLLPSRSSIRIRGRLIDTVSNTLPKNTRFVNNGICYLFEDAHLELNGIEIDRCKNVGLSTLMKNWVTLHPNKSTIMRNAGWFGLFEEHGLVNDQGDFDVFIPLSMILGFAEDYKKIMVNVKLEFILTRSRDDLNAILQAGTVANEVTIWDHFKIDLTRIEWLMPYVQVSDSRKISLFKFLEKDHPITISFRSKNFFEYPLLPATPKRIWVVKTSNQPEKSRFIIVGLQTQKKSV